jgi:hypothetical protein
MPKPADTAPPKQSDTAEPKPAEAAPPKLAPITNEVAVGPPPGVQTKPVSLLPAQEPVDAAAVPSPDAPPKKPGPGSGGLY